MSPRKFYSLAVRDNKIAIGTDTKIQLGELKDNNYWALMKSAGGNQSKMKDFVKLEIEDTNTFVISSCWKSHDVHVIDMINSRVMGSFNCGEPVLNIKISPDHKYLITTSSKGCFYVWKLPLRIVASMKFRENQKDLLSNHPSLDNNNMALSKIKEDDELSDDNDFCDVDEGKREEPRRKEWAKIDKRPSNFGSQPPPTILDKSSSENVRLKTEVELFEDTALDITNKSDNDQESDNEEDVFDLLNSPTGHEEENFKTKYEFTGIVEKKRRASYIRRDSKIGKLKEKANNLKSESSWEDRKHSSCLDDNARIRSHNVEKQFIDFSDGHQNKRSVIQRFTGYENLEESSSKDELKKEVTQISKSIDKCIRVMQIQGSLTNDPEISQLMILLNMKMNTLQNAYFHSMLSTNLSTKHDGSN